MTAAVGDGGRGTRRGWLYGMLEHAGAYRAIMRLLAPGAERDLVSQLEGLLAELPPTRRFVDVGCGPTSWLWRVRREPVGVDLFAPYLRPWRAAGHSAVVASADRLPFRSGSVGGVWSVGLLHHLDDTQAAAAVAEMLRICEPGGYVAILDAVNPVRAWTRPLASLLRRLDRGRHVRSEPGMRQLLSQGTRFATRRIRYSRFGLEMLICIHLAPPPIPGAPGAGDR